MNLPAVIQSPINVVCALLGSLVGSDVAYYPRRADSGENISPEDVLDEIGKPFGSFAFSSGDPKLLLDCARNSLEEARKQTEYQDAKAGRLLTIVAFLTAAIGTVFGKFIDLYPLHNIGASASGTSLLVTTTYGLFGLYLFLVAAGALVTFHAMSTRFVWPGDKDQADKVKVGSLLFFKQVIRTQPGAWGKLFVGDQDVLLRKYYENYAAEAYLISAKVADKLRYLDPGQRLLNLSIRVLLGLFCSLIVTFAMVVPPPKLSVETVRSGLAASAPPLAAPRSDAAALTLPSIEQSIAGPGASAASSQGATPLVDSMSQPTSKPSAEKR
ncbi:hypothetical protein [Aquabacterium sp.]|uniref:hypothetical protein n=1 Tax=Aquabacterium sp. TaxID=1872578 RepID=UPI003D6D1DE5